MIITHQPKNVIPALLFIIIATAISAYVTYYVNERLKQENA